MKALIIAAALIAPTTAQAANPICYGLYNVAYASVIARHQGSTAQESMRVADDFGPSPERVIIRAIVIEAHLLPAAVSDHHAVDQASAFAQKWLTDCEEAQGEGD